MSTEASGTDDGDGPEVGPCRNVEQYAIEYLESHDGTASPSEIADEYGCTPGHAQDQMRQSEALERVEIGEYALSAGTDTEDTDLGKDMESGGVAGFGATTDTEGTDSGVQGPSAGGGPQSGDPGTTDQDQEGNGLENIGDRLIDKGRDELDDADVPNPFDISQDLALKLVVGFLVVVAIYVYFNKGDSTPVLSRLEDDGDDDDESSATTLFMDEDGV